MRQVRKLTDLERDRATVLTIGAFDGVHLGHQFLIRQVVERARRLEYDSMVVTFDPRPLVLLRPGSLQLTDGLSKARVIATLEPDIMAMLEFTRELASVPAEAFLLSVLDRVSVAEVWVGGDFAFGHNRTGDVNFLIRNGEAYSFAVHVVPRQKLEGMPISSSHIRACLSKGDVEGATRMLGHYPGFYGQVVSGYGRGAQLGFPTANVQPPSAQLLPATGIYATYATLGARRLKCAVSVGYNPVFGGKRIVVEAYILDFDEDIRGREIGLDFVARIRDEEGFSTVDALVQQMNRDVDQVRAALDPV
ncbi:MAG: riboflavin biosynthesis protein RibF [Chloroflexota bacterium]|nr:MAG: riboflavin biosynthesis protein RibF [Chloroflexota bacterium]